MADKLLTVVITLPDQAPKDEAERIRYMLESGLVDRVHIRKPEWRPEQIDTLIRAIGNEFYHQLSLHSCPQLLDIYPNIGFYISASRTAPVKRPTMLSYSCHTLEEVYQKGKECDYVTLSPVFDSISKQGYTAATFEPVSEYNAVQTALTVAL